MEIHIDEKFKDMPPEKTVEKIQSILNALGIEVEETWYESGIENCYSLSVKIKNGYPSSNGKGVTKALARASAYAEFIERLQQGLHYYKLQSITEDPEMNLHSYAPDAKYMTMKELVDNGEWMDFLIQSYGGSLSREKIAQYCKTFACTDEDKILTLPYYSLFEDKYIYMPAGFVDQVYVSNGCCAGNTQEEALVHAISEIFERHHFLSLLLRGTSAPRIPNSVLQKYPTVTKILGQIHARGDYDVTIFDISNGNGFPVVASRIINKSTHKYLINAAADPILEIAIQRTLTEVFQGKSIDNFHTNHNSKILNAVSDISLTANAWNAIECSHGLFTANFFADEILTSDSCTVFHDNTNKTNKELLDYVFTLCKRIGKPVYIRNYDYLGFVCYKVIIPGYSEGAWLQLLDPVNEYAFGHELKSTLMNVSAANKNSLIMLLMYQKMVANKVGRIHNFSRLSGIPLSGHVNYLLPTITFAYATYKLQRYDETYRYCTELAQINSLDESITQYLSCIAMYLKLKMETIADIKIRSILYKFFRQEYTDKLYAHLDQGETPFDSLILKCDYNGCYNCRYAEYCTYHNEKKLIKKIGNIYKHFEGGQDKNIFPKMNGKCQ